MTWFWRKKQKITVEEYNVKERYQKLYDIGKGGLAHVSCAFDRNLNRIVALKQLKKEHKENPVFIDLFLNEAKLLSYLSHPGIIAVYDRFTDKADNLYYSMKIIDGDSLKDYIDKSVDENFSKTFSLSKMINILTSLCETMAYVHDRGVVHLDLKPSNIMIGEYGEVMIVDWGAALLYDHKPYKDNLEKYFDEVYLSTFYKDEEYVSMGSPLYVSPEQTDMPRRLLRPTSDIFSMGTILYQMATGKLPFTGDSNKEIFEQIRSHDPESLPVLNPEIPPRLSEICLKMLQKKRHLRYADFHEVLKDLHDFQSSVQSRPIHTYETDEIIFKEGDTGDYAFIILSGQVEISRSVDNKSTVLNTVDKGDIVGELALFTKETRTATVKALEPTTVRIMREEDVDAELDKLNPMVEKMITSLADRFIHLENKIQSSK